MHPTQINYKLTQLRRMRRKFQLNQCPYDDTIAELKGGLQEAPKWLNAVRKFPPEKTYLFPGKLGRPSFFTATKYVKFY